jgi:hypothetical protein
MLAQLEVKEINSRTSKDFPVLEFFFQFKDFPGFSRPVDTLSRPVNQGDSCCVREQQSGLKIATI